MLTHAATDHRHLGAEGGLFAAIKGEKADGHSFVAAAGRGGAVAAFVRRDRAEGLSGVSEQIALIVVDEVERAMWDLAAALRQDVTVPVLAVTGSMGKTTTKNMLAGILNATLGTGCATTGNKNNLLGVPLTVISCDPEDRYLLAELGSNAFGEIEALTKLVRPQVGIVTCVGAAHLEGFRDLNGVLREKSSLPRNLEAGGTAVYPSFDALLAADAAGWGVRTATFGNLRSDLVRVASSQEGVAAEGTVECEGRIRRVKLSMSGAFNLWNAAAAIAAARVVGVGFEAACEAVSTVRAEGMRMEWREAAGVRFLVDAYNANPGAMKAALEALAGQTGGRRFAVLGTMLELGPRWETLHEEVGIAAGQAGLELLIGMGAGGRCYVRGAGQGCEAIQVADQEEAAALLRERCRPGDIVLLKGSRGSRVERVLEQFAGGGN
jgi:UDP-N-acetylmuramoyl-tripeptide--D-alanyl-D-alanine ligase